MSRTKVPLSTLILSTVCSILLGILLMSTQRNAHLQFELRKAELTSSYQEKTIAHYRKVVLEYHVSLDRALRMTKDCQNALVKATFQIQERVPKGNPRNVPFKP